MVSRPIGRASSVFVDSSVLIAAAISVRGAARDLLLEGLRGQRELRLSTFVFLETQRNLQKKRPAALSVFASFRAALVSAVVDPPDDLVQQVSAAVEPKDAPIVAGALHAQSAYLATSDRRHLLNRRDAIQSALGVVVATPDEILGISRGE